MSKISLNKELPKEVRTVIDALNAAGFEAYLVGGCVRDLLLEREPRDWDVTTNAKPDDIIKVFEHTFYDNQFGTVGVVFDDTGDPALKTIEVTTYRLEHGYSDARHPDVVAFSNRLEDDLRRRDFTVNAIALHTDGTIIDPHGGLMDLEKRLIGAVGDPEERFREDALRLLRAVRLAVELDFKVSQETATAIRDTAPNLQNIARERIRDEFSRIIMSDRPKEGLEIAHEYGLLQYILPEVELGLGVEQNQAHSYNVWEHNLRTLQAAADKGWRLEVRLAALLHDVAKPKTRAWDDKKGDWSFHNHQVVGARMAKMALQGLRYPNEVVDTVYTLVRWHMFFSDTDVMTHSAVRRIVRNVGKELIWDLINLRVCDRVGTGRPKEQPYRLRKFKSMVEEVMRDPLSVDMLAIDGRKVMEVTHETPGPRIGYILHALLEEVIEEPSKNTPEYLVSRSSELAELPPEELKMLGMAGKIKIDEEEMTEVGKIRGKYGVE